MDKQIANRIIIAGTYLQRINDEYERKVKGWLKMTKVGRAFEEEKQEAVREAEKEEAKRIAKSLLDVLSLELIAEKTGLDIEEVEKLKRAEDNLY
ncbi:hypothetical protein [Oceanobacillus caeni]|uniref:hypothetical protein n=2 Tax=Bacillaceae TaxID=186817 RepID=UPI0011B41397